MPTAFYWDMQSYVQKAAHRSVDFAGRMADIFGDQLLGIDASPLVFLTRASDDESNALSMALAKRGVVTTRANADSAHSMLTLTQCLTLPPEEPSVRIRSGRVVSGPNPALYFRHFTTAAISDGLPANEHPSLESIYLREQWMSALLALDSSGCTAINAPRHTSVLDRVGQLTLARRQGFATPRGIVTNDPNQLHAFTATCPDGAIIKALGDHFLEPVPGTMHGIFPAVIKDASSLMDMVGDSDRDGAPLLCQEFIRHDHELRVYVAGDTAIAFSIRKSSSDAEWTDPSSLQIHAEAGNGALLASTVALVRSASIQVAALDFLVRGNDVIFLEVNAVGDWRWLEQEVEGEPVTDLHADYLIGLLR